MIDIVTESMVQNDDDHQYHCDVNETIEAIETAEVEIIPSVTIRKVKIEPSFATTTASAAATVASIKTTATTARPNEVVSYQRFGRVDKKTITYPFKCHLCGFSCRFKESLLSHFKQVHPY